jgi:Rad3-related DNA helicase
MKLSIGNKIVFFPFEEISPEQIQVMFVLQKLWKKKCNGVIGVPPTIGLPVAVISFYLSCNLNLESRFRLLYVNETVLENEKIFRNFDNFNSFTENYFNNKNCTYLISPYLEKTRLCIHTDFKKVYKTEEIEDLCLSLILPSPKRKKVLKINKNDKYFGKKVKIYQGCVFFKNFAEKKFKKTSGLWNIKNIRRQAIKKQICPFYFSRELLFESHLIVIQFENFFSAEILGIDIKKILKTSFLIVDSVKNFDSVMANLTVSELNSLVLNDCIRGLLYLKKKVLYKISKKFFYLICRTPTKKINKSNHNKINDTEEKKIKDYKFYKKSKVITRDLNSTRILKIIAILIQISKFIKTILMKKIKINTSLDQFFGVLIHKLKEYQISSKCFCSFNDYIMLMAFNTHLLDLRYLNCLKYLTWFLLKFGILLECTNENFRLVTISSTTTKNLLVDSVLFLCCFEIPLFSRLIFENTISFLVFTTQNSFLFSGSSVFDQSQIYYGNLRLVFKKCFVSYQEMILGKNSNKEKPKVFSQEDFFLSKKVISVLLQISDSSPSGVICLFSSYSILLGVIKNLNNSIILNEMKNKRNIFIESFFQDLGVIEEYKISCDLGIKSIFFGLSGGILFKINIDNHYSRFVLKIQTKLIFLSKFRKIYILWQRLNLAQYSFLSLIEIGNYPNNNSISRNFFGSKKDYGVFLNIRQIYDSRNGEFESKIETIVEQKMIKNEGLSTTERIDKFFKYYSNFNIGI